MKASDPRSAAQLKRALPYIGTKATSDDKADAEKLADAVEGLLGGSLQCW